MVSPDGLISVHGITERHLLTRAATHVDGLHKTSAGTPQPIDMSGGLTVPRGQFIFNAEGTDNPHSPYFSRVLCWPGEDSGVTIGRGYDMKKRSKSEIFANLRQANIDADIAHIMSGGSHLIGSSALHFVHKNKEICGVITRTQQINLFNIIYPFYYNDTKRIYNKYKSKDGCAWDSLNPRISTIMIDMRFQGGFVYWQVPIFEQNNVNAIIDLIRTTILLSYEKNRHRINFLKNGIIQ